MWSNREVVRSAVKVAVATIANLFGWVIAGKVLAIQLGPAGVGTFGLLRQLLQNLTILGSLNGHTALVQGVASAKSPEARARYAGSVLIIQSLVTCTLVAALVVLAPVLGPVLIAHPAAPSLLRWLAVALAASILQSYGFGLLNGHGLLTQLVRAQLVSPLAVVLFVLPMVWLVRHERPAGFVLMLTAPSAMVSLAAAFAAARARVWPGRPALQLHPRDAKHFLRTSAALLATAGIATGMQYLQSRIIVARFGLAEAGIFWTAWTLSMSYVTLALGSLGTYYLPNLTRVDAPEQRIAMIRTYMRLCLTVLPALIASVTLLKPLVVRLMFSASLLPALKVMRWMLIADLFKGISWVLAFPMLAFADLRWFVWSELAFTCGFGGAALAVVLTGHEVEGIGVMFMVAYAMYFSAMVYYAQTKHGYRFMPHEWRHLSAGIALVAVVSGVSWSDESVRPPALATFGIGVALFIALVERPIVAQLITRGCAALASGNKA